jgi:DtxR family manganese transport transcriptional regulator
MAAWEWKDEPMPLPDPGEQARRFAKVRLAHRSEVQEDYVELIADLIAERGEARIVDLAERFGVTTATVANTLTRLKRDGLVENRPYRSLFLTEAGLAMADAARARHDLVIDFLVRLGVPRAAAELDAEGLEHHLSPETLEAMRRFGG